MTKHTTQLSQPEFSLDETPYFPSDLENYAPWVAKHGLRAPYGECQCGCGQRTTIISMKSTARGYFKGDPFRFVMGHYARTHPKRPVAERFWEKVDKRGPDECWEWQGRRTYQDYGQFSADGRHRPAHQIAWEIENGPIPDNMIVCHHCDRPPCVNPAHLFVGTYLDNSRDMDAKGRRVRVGHPGEKNPHASLCSDDIRKIRKLATQGLLHREIAKQFGVARATVSGIIRRKSWAHIE